MCLLVFIIMQISVSNTFFVSSQSCCCYNVASLQSTIDLICNRQSKYSLSGFNLLIISFHVVLWTRMCIGLYGSNPKLKTTYSYTTVYLLINNHLVMWRYFLQRSFDLENKTLCKTNMVIKKMLFMHVLTSKHLLYNYYGLSCGNW